MNPWLAFLLGWLAGGSCGVFVMALFNLAKDSDDAADDSP